MWTRIELKERAKKSFYRFYWGAVAVCLAAFLFTGEFGGNAGSGNGRDYPQSSSQLKEDERKVKGVLNTLLHNQLTDGVREITDETLSPLDKMGTIGRLASRFIKAPLYLLLYAAPAALGLLLLCFGFLIGNPLLVGCKRYFMMGRQGDAKAGTVFYAFKHHYTNVVGTMLCVNLFTVLWFFLLVIPGIVKMYEYSMIPYILSENPGIDRTRAFALSKQMMEGQKWKAFVLDLSFILWRILGAVTLQLGNIFYVFPYIEATSGELYATLRGHLKMTENVEPAELPGYP